VADAADFPVSSVPETIGTDSILIAWTMAGTSTGRAIRYVDFVDKSINARGTWGSATLVFEGTLFDEGDPDSASYASPPTGTWSTLTDTSETPLSTTVDLGVTSVLQLCKWVRPKTTGGTGTAVTFVLVGKR
jgi:hypothetical protein